MIDREPVYAFLRSTPDAPARLIAEAFGISVPSARTIRREFLATYTPSVESVTPHVEPTEIELLDDEPPLDPPWKQDFIVALLDHGIVARAARAVGKHRQRCYEARATDPRFAERWDEAAERVIDEVEGAMVRMALSGNALAGIFILRHRRASVYHDSLEIRHSGVVDHQHGLLEGKEPREVPAATRHQIAALLLEAGVDAIDSDAEELEDDAGGSA